MITHACGVFLAAFATLSLNAAPAPDAGPRAIDVCQAGMTTGGLLEDPLSLQDVELARHALHAWRPHLTVWSHAYPAWDPELVRATLATLRKANVDVDGAGARALFFVVQRALVRLDTVTERLPALAALLHVSEAEAHRAVFFVTQLDALAAARELPAEAPLFLRDAADGPRFVARELGTRLDPAFATFLNDSMLGVLRQNLRYTRLGLNADRTQLIIRTPVSVIRINLVAKDFDRPAIAEPLVSATVAWGFPRDLVNHRQSDVFVGDPEQANYFATIIRPDPFLHPHARRPAATLYPRRTILSDWQESEGVMPMLAMAKTIRASKVGRGPIYLGLQSPVGTGKSPMSLAVLDRLPRPSALVRPRYIVLVDNNHLLDQLVPMVRRDTGARPGKMAMLYGDRGVQTFSEGSVDYTVPRGAGITPPGDWDVIFINGDTFDERKSSLDFAIDTENAKPPEKRRPFRIFADEAHHGGVEDGRLNRLLDYFEEKLRPDDAILMASATLEHPQTNIIRDRLGGHVVAPLLMPDDVASLRRGERPLEHARTQMILGMLAGLINPVDARSFTTVENEPFRERLRRGRATDREVYVRTAELIKATRPTNGMFDRGLIFEPEITRANEGADFLQDMLPTRGEVRTALAAHSALTPVEGRRRVRWLRGAGEFKGTDDQPKYLVSVDQFFEGLDVPEVNLLVVQRNLRSLLASMHLVGRGGRIDAFKTGWRLIDLSGYITEFLEGAGVLWLRASRPRDVSLIGWGKPPNHGLRLSEPERVDPLPPLAVRPIDMDPVIEKQRRQLAQGQPVTPEDLAAALNPNDGVLALLKRSPAGDVAIDELRFAAWFGHVLAQFSENARARWQSAWLQLRLDDRPVDPARLTAEQRKSAVRAFRLLGRMFNALDSRERLGLADLEAREELTRSGFTRLRLGLTRRPRLTDFAGVPARLTPLPFGPAGFAHREELRENLDEGLMFAGASDEVRGLITRAAAEASASDALDLLVRVLIERPSLERAIGEYVRALRADAMRPVERFQREVAATYALALIVNVLIREQNLDADAPWDLHAMVDRENGGDVLVEGLNAKPTYYDLLMTLDMADTRLGGESAPPPRALPLAPKASPATPATPIASKTPRLAPAAGQSVLTGPDGTLTWLNRTTRVRNPERLIHEYLTRIEAYLANVPGRAPVAIPTIEPAPELSVIERLANALRAAETYYNSLSPLDRLGYPELGPGQIQEWRHFVRLEFLGGKPGEPKIEFYDLNAADILRRFPFEPLDGIQLDEIVRAMAKYPGYINSDMKKFIEKDRQRWLDARTADEAALLLSELFIAGYQEGNRSIKLLRGEFRRAGRGSPEALARGVLMLAGSINGLLRYMGVNDEPLIDLAAMFPNAPELPPQTIRFRDVLTTLARHARMSQDAFWQNFGGGTLGQLSEVSDTDRSSMILDDSNWGVVTRAELESARRPGGLLTKIGNGEIDPEERSKRSFGTKDAAWAPTHERFVQAIRVADYEKDVKSKDFDAIANIQESNMMAATVNSLSAIDRLGLGPITRADVVGGRVRALVSTIMKRNPFEDIFGFGGHGPGPYPRIAIGPKDRLNELRAQAAAGSLINGTASGQLRKMLLGPEITLRADEFLTLVLTQILANDRLRSLFAEGVLADLLVYQVNITQADSGRREPMVAAALAVIVNHILRERKLTEFKPCDLGFAIDGGRAVAADDDRFMPLTYVSVLEVLNLASSSDEIIVLSRHGITQKVVAEIKNPKGRSFLAHIFRALGDWDKSKPRLIRLDKMVEQNSSGLASALRARYADQLASLRLPRKPFDMATLGDLDVAQFTKAVLTYEMIFNAGDAVERLGWARVPDHAFLTGEGYEVLGQLRGINLRFIDLEPVSSPRLASRLGDASERSIDGPLATQFDDARDVIDVLDRTCRIISASPRLLSHFDQLDRVFLTKVESFFREKTEGDWSGVAAHTLARIVNVLIREGGVTGVKPFNLQEANGLLKGQVVDEGEVNMEPTIDDVIDVLQRAK